MRHPILLAVSLTIAALIGISCGEPSSQVASLGDREASQKSVGSRKPPDDQALLDFAKCMREHGIDMPDPEVGEGGIIKIGPGEGGPSEAKPILDSEKFEEADKACRKHLPMFGGDGEVDLDPADQEAFLAFARCMREQGIDMPDPDPNRGGMVLRKGEGPEPDDEDFRAAEKVCRKHLAPIDRKAVTREEP